MKTRCLFSNLNEELAWGWLFATWRLPLRLWTSGLRLMEKLSTVSRPWGSVAWSFYEWKDGGGLRHYGGYLFMHPWSPQLSPWNSWGKRFLAQSIARLSVLPPVLCRVQPLRSQKELSCPNLQNEFLESAVLSAATRESLIVTTWVFSNLKFCHSIRKWVMEALSKLFHFNNTQGFHCVWLQRCNALLWNTKSFSPILKKKRKTSTVELFLLFFPSFPLFHHFELQSSAPFPAVM